MAWFIVAARLYDIIWLVAPTFNKGAFPISLANIGIPLALAGGVFLNSETYRRRFIESLHTLGITPGPTQLVPDPAQGRRLARDHRGGRGMGATAQFAVGEADRRR